MNIEAAMRKIVEQLADFVEQIVEDMGLQSNYYYKMELRNKLYFFYLYNKTTHVVAGKCIPYKELAEMCIQKKVEFEFNKLTREMIAKSSATSRPVPKNTKNGTFQVNTNDVLWV